MHNMCNCENGKVNLANEGIFFLTNLENQYYELECAICGEKVNINESIYGRYDGLCIIDIRDLPIDKSFYHDELKYVLKILERLEKCEISYELLYEILTYIIYIYNKEYYELFYMYKFETLRENIVKLVIKKYSIFNIGYESYESFIKDLIKEMENVESNFEIVKFLNTSISKDTYIYGPCTFLDKTDDNPNQKFLEKNKYKENEIEIDVEIMALQLENSEIIEKYVINCYKSKLLSKKFMDLIYKYENEKKYSFYKAFLQCINEDCEDEILPTDKVIVIGLKVVLEEVLKSEEVELKDITSENYKEILQELKNNNVIIKKFLSKE